MTSTLVSDDLNATDCKLVNSGMLHGSFTEPNYANSYYYDVPDASTEIEISSDESESRLNTQSGCNSSSSSQQLFSGEYVHQFPTSPFSSSCDTFSSARPSPHFVHPLDWNSNCTMHMSRNLLPLPEPDAHPSLNFSNFTPPPPPQRSSSLPYFHVFPGQGAMPFNFNYMDTAPIPPVPPPMPIHIDLPNHHQFLSSMILNQMSSVHHHHLQQEQSPPLLERAKTWCPNTISQLKCLPPLPPQPSITSPLSPNRFIQNASLPVPLPLPSPQHECDTRSTVEKLNSMLSAIVKDPIMAGDIKSEPDCNVSAECVSSQPDSTLCVMDAISPPRIFADAVDDPNASRLDPSHGDQDQETKARSPTCSDASFSPSSHSGDSPATVSSTCFTKDEDDESCSRSRGTGRKRARLTSRESDVPSPTSLSSSYSTGSAVSSSPSAQQEDPSPSSSASTRACIRKLDDPATEQIVKKLLAIIERIPDAWNGVNVIDRDSTSLGCHQATRKAWAEVALNMNQDTSIDNVNHWKKVFKRKRDQYNGEYLRGLRPNFQYVKEMRFLDGVLTRHTMKNLEKDKSITFEEVCASALIGFDFEKALEVPGLPERIPASLKLISDTMSALKTAGCDSNNNSTSTIPPTSSPGKSMVTAMMKECVLEMHTWKEKRAIAKSRDVKDF